MATASTGGMWDLSKTIYKLVMDFLGPKIKRKGAEWQELVECWEHILGNELARVSYPIKITERARGKVLEIGVDRACSTEIHFRLPRMQELINDHFGREFLSALKIVAVDSRMPAILQEGA